MIRLGRTSVTGYALATRLGLGGFVGNDVDGVFAEVASAEVADDTAAPFADWMAGVPRREGMTMEAAARQLGVSVKTVSRWVCSATEPRLRDLRRIRELYGDLPFT